MSKRIGAQTVALPSKPGLIGWAGIAGQKEKEGPYGVKFDQIIPDELNGQQSFESAERAMLEQAITLCARKAGKRLDEVQMLLSGRFAESNRFGRICGAQPRHSVLRAVWRMLYHV